MQRLMRPTTEGIWNIIEREYIMELSRTMVWMTISITCSKMICIFAIALKTSWPVDVIIIISNTWPISHLLYWQLPKCIYEDFVREILIYWALMTNSDNDIARPTWRLKSPINRMLVQQRAQVNCTEKISAWALNICTNEKYASTFNLDV